ncbi:hypothetical protein [Ruegeria sp. HKCCSP335]|uniref:hypothetical protein n=1 Tax=Ruegeria sp. HKCCSP335 TaxID=2794833 RepID=UPI001AE3FFD0|nr:hypothetical protein [Ruegeria sp. HKCCSP335]
MAFKNCTNLVLITCITAFGHSAWAGTVELNRAVYQVIPFDMTSPNVDKRLEFAQAIEAYWADLNQKVPRLSPKEIEWLEGELANTPGPRFTKAINSPEYGFYMVEQKIDLCLENVRNVIEAINMPERNEIEMYFCEPPQLNWSTVMFRKRRTTNGKQETEARRDCLEVTAG